MNHAPELSARAPAHSLPARERCIALALLVLLVAMAWWPTFCWLWSRYEAPDSLYGHGPLVPLVILGLLWRDRRELAARVSPGSAWGLPLIFAAVLVHGVALAIRVHSPSGFALPLLLAGLVWWLGGGALLRRLFFPLGFLLFAIPVPLFFVVRAAQMLKNLVMALIHLVHAGLGTGLDIEGSYLVLPSGGRLLVDDECAGMRSLVALVALGVLMAGTSRDARLRDRLVVVLLALPIALFANTLRVLLLSLLALSQGVETAAAWHDPSSYAVYAVAILLYVGVERSMASKPRRKPLP